VNDKFGHPESDQCHKNLKRKGNVALKGWSHERGRALQIQS
jgi:hypothetical protein